MKPAHPLDEIVAAGWAPSVPYLQKRLRRREIPGRKIGRHWFMDDDDVEAYKAMVRNTPSERAELQPRFGLTAASSRRRSA